MSLDPDGTCIPPVPPLRPEIQDPLPYNAQKMNSRELGPGLHKTSFAAGMVAAGVTKQKTVEVIGGRADNLSKLLRPHAVVIQSVRDKLKRRKMLKMQRIEAELWPRIEREVKSGDAKGVDALARAAMNFEKIQAQVSGENQQLTLTHEGDPLVDLKVLIQNLLGPSS